MDHKELDHESVRNDKIIMVKRILLMTASLLIIGTILTQGLFLYLQYKSHNTQVIVYELDNESAERYN